MAIYIFLAEDDLAIYYEQLGCAEEGQRASHSQPVNSARFKCSLLIISEHRSMNLCMDDDCLI